MEVGDSELFISKFSLMFLSEGEFVFIDFFNRALEHSIRNVGMVAMVTKLSH